MNVLIIEDEKLSASRLKKMILEYDESINILAILDSIEASVSYLMTNKEPDLVFLDIQLSDGESFSIFKEVEMTSPVIFTTAFNEHAIRAFTVNSIDYLLKPIKKADLARALKKFAKLKTSHQPDYIEMIENFNRRQYNYPKRMMVRLGAVIKSLEINNIAYFFIHDRITYATAKDGSKYPIDQSLEKLEPELDPQQFFRINRQFIISHNAIDRMIAYSKSRIKVVLDPPSPIDAISSSEKTPFFKKWLDGN